MKNLSLAILMVSFMACSPIAKTPANDVATKDVANKQNTTGQSADLNKVKNVAGAEVSPTATPTDVFSEGANGDLERAMVQDAALLELIRKIEVDPAMAVDCASPRVGQVRRANDCSDHCCDFSLDISCVARLVDEQVNTDGVRVTLKGQFDYSGKKYILFLDMAQKQVLKMTLSVGP